MLRLDDAKQDRLPPDVKLKQFYLDRAAARINEATAYEGQHPLIMDARGALSLATEGRAETEGEHEAMLCLAHQTKDKERDAGLVLDAILNEHPHHIPAMLGRARLLVRAGNHRAALKVYQKVLQMAPRTLPDPRIGIGSCLWQLGDKARARQAWERSMALVSEACRSRKGKADGPARIRASTRSTRGYCSASRITPRRRTRPSRRRCGWTRSRRRQHISSRCSKPLRRLQPPPVWPTTCSPLAIGSASVSFAALRSPSCC